jgi:hypothetical protein
MHMQRQHHNSHEELDQAMKDIRRFGDQGAETNWRIAELESLYRQHEEAIAKLKQENMSLEMGIQSRNELIMEIAAEVGLNRMGEDDNDEEDAPAALAVAATPEVDASKKKTRRCYFQNRRPLRHWLSSCRMRSLSHRSPIFSPYS